MSRSIMRRLVVVCFAIGVVLVPLSSSTAMAAQYKWPLPLTNNPTCFVGTQYKGTTTPPLSCYQAHPTGIRVFCYRCVGPGEKSSILFVAFTNFESSSWNAQHHEGWLLRIPQTPIYTKFLGLPGPAEYSSFPDRLVLNLAVAPWTDYIATSGMKIAHVGQPYRFTLTAGGGKGPFVWSTFKPLPTGLSMSSIGVITGTPQRPGTWVMGVRVTNGDGIVAENLPMSLVVK